MKNKNLEIILGQLNIETQEELKEIEREKFTTNLDKDMLSDYKELCNALKIKFNVGIEAMFSMLSNNKEFLKCFLDELNRL